jgi:hypothetical protein
MFRTISLVGSEKTCFPSMGFAVVGEPNDPDHLDRIGSAALTEFKIAKQTQGLSNCRIRKGKRAPGTTFTAVAAAAFV